jgi:hypothetical protein
MIKISLILSLLILTTPYQSHSQDLNVMYPKEKLLELITEKMSYTLSTELFYHQKMVKLTGSADFYKYPEGQPVPIRIANFDNNEKTYYCVVEFPKDFKI